MGSTRPAGPSLPGHGDSQEGRPKHAALLAATRLLRRLPAPALGLGTHGRAAQKRSQVPEGPNVPELWKSPIPLNPNCPHCVLPGARRLKLAALTVQSLWACEAAYCEESCKPPQSSLST